MYLPKILSFIGPLSPSSCNSLYFRFTDALPYPLLSHLPSNTEDSAHESHLPPTYWSPPAHHGSHCWHRQSHGASACLPHSWRASSHTGSGRSHHASCPSRRCSSGASQERSLWKRLRGDQELNTLSCFQLSAAPCPLPVRPHTSSLSSLGLAFFVEGMRTWARWSLRAPLAQGR